MRKLILIPILLLAACQKTNIQCKNDIFQGSTWVNDSMCYNNVNWFYNLNTTWTFTDDSLIVVGALTKSIPYSFEDDCRYIILQDVKREIVFNSNSNFVLKSDAAYYYFSR